MFFSVVLFFSVRSFVFAGGKNAKERLFAPPLLAARRAFSSRAPVISAVVVAAVCVRSKQTLTKRYMKF